VATGGGTTDVGAFGVDARVVVGGAVVVAGKGPAGGAALSHGWSTTAPSPITAAKSIAVAAAINGARHRRASDLRETGAGLVAVKEDGEPCADVVSASGTILQLVQDRGYSHGEAQQIMIAVLTSIGTYEPAC
jgi:hypothetical protein